MDIMETIYEQNDEKEENVYNENFDDNHEETGRAIRSDGIAPGGVDAVDEEAKNTTDRKDVQGLRRYTGRAGIAPGGVDSVGKGGQPGEVASEIDVQGQRRYPGRAGIAPGGVDSDGGKKGKNHYEGGDLPRLQSKQNAAEFFAIPPWKGSTTLPGNEAEAQRNKSENAGRSGNNIEGGDLPPLHGRGNAAQISAVGKLLRQRRQ